MTPDVIKELNSEGQSDRSEFHESLLGYVKGLVKASRCEMSKFYCDWDLQDQVYRGERCPDTEDLKNELEEKPVKMVVPNTFAQVMTFTSFLFLMFNQNKTFFELLASGTEDFGTKKLDSEALLQRDLRKNQWNSVLFQHLLDVGRFGPGILECCWTKKMTRAYVTPEPVAQVVNGVETIVRSGSEWQEFVKYEGNLVRAISPYRFFPDTSLPLTEFGRGRFCAAEEEYTISQLRDMAVAGEVAGVDNIRQLSSDWVKQRGGETRSPISSNEKLRNGFDAEKHDSVVLVTKVQVWIVPSKYMITETKKLGPEEFPVLYHIWYANDNTILRVEPAYWWHNEFGWTVAQFTPDMQHTLTMGLADLVYRLQDVISWFVNAHISSVRRVMQNRLIVDPRVVDTKTLDGEGDVYLRKGVTVPLERAVGQLRVQDVTSGHMADVDILGKLMEVVTGVNGNAMGQYNSGRRSAQEARVVTAGAAGRMKMHGHLIWESSLGRLGRLMLSNLRQSLSPESFARAIGAEGQDPERYAMFKGTPEEIVCGDDYMVFDSTLSSEKGFMAQSLQELFSIIMQSDPMAARSLSMRLDPMKIVEEIQNLRGSGTTHRFSYSPEQQQQMMQMQAALMAQPSQAA